MSKPLILELKEKVENLDTNITNLLLTGSTGNKTLNDSYLNYKKLIFKVRNTETLPKTGIVVIPVESISNGEIYVVSSFQDASYHISASIRFIDENTVNISEIKDTGWAFGSLVIDGIN